MFIAIKLTDSSIRNYFSEEEATSFCRHINRKDDSHPSFDLYKLNGRRKATYIGRFRRGFGTDEFFWSK